MATDDQALFNRFALRIFAKLQEAFPTEIALRPHDILKEEGMEPTAHALAICDRKRLVGSIARDIFGRLEL